MSKKVALWTPFLNVLGGGEKHVLDIVNFFIRNGYTLTIFWDAQMHDQIYEAFSIRLPKNTRWLPSLNNLPLIHRLRVLSDIDEFIYVTDGSYIISTARHTSIFCMVPDPRLYSRTLINRIKTRGNTWLCNSYFTKRVLSRQGIDAKVIYPIITTKTKVPMLAPKKSLPGTAPTFLSVGRFFTHLHAKRQDVAIAWFITFIEQNPRYRTSNLILAGGLKKEDQEYFDSLRALISGYEECITLKPNVSRDELVQLYDQAHYYLHFAGWQVDELKHPEQVEHLGITPLEAMMHDCVVFAYSAGGIREIIKDGYNGFTFTKLDELSQKIRLLDSQRTVDILAAARDTLVKHFSESSFYERMAKLYVHAEF
jgi:glycosyltransferase involved in cell wall biosynthesis